MRLPSVTFAGSCSSTANAAVEILACRLLRCNKHPGRVPGRAERHWHVLLLASRRSPFRNLFSVRLGCRLGSSQPKGALPCTPACPSRSEHKAGAPHGTLSPRLNRRTRRRRSRRSRSRTLSELSSSAPSPSTSWLLASTTTRFTSSTRAISTRGRLCARATRHGASRDSRSEPRCAWRHHRAASERMTGAPARRVTGSRGSGRTKSLREKPCLAQGSKLYVGLDGKGIQEWSVDTSARLGRSSALIA